MRRKPNCIDSQRFEIIQFGNNSNNVSRRISTAAIERFRPNLLQDEKK